MSKEDVVFSLGGNKNQAMSLHSFKNVEKQRKKSKLVSEAAAEDDGSSVKNIDHKDPKDRQSQTKRKLDINLPPLKLDKNNFRHSVVA